MFGNDTVSYGRAWTSASGMPMIHFVRMAALEQNFVTSGRNNRSASILLRNLTNGTPLPIKGVCQSQRRGILRGLGEQQTSG